MQMKDIVSYETAVRLKEAGFPQPTPEAGQVWYHGLLKKDAAVLIANFKTHDGSQPSSTLYFLNGSGSSIVTKVAEESIYAPTATDILRELPSYSLFFSSLTRQWVGAFDEMAITYNEHNPAEAAAEAWLKINEK